MTSAVVSPPEDANGNGKPPRSSKVLVILSELVSRMRETKLRAELPN